MPRVRAQAVPRLALADCITAGPMAQSRPMCDGEDLFTEGELIDAELDELSDDDGDDSDAVSPPTSPQRKTQNARNAKRPFPGYAAARRATIKVLYHKYGFADHFEGRELLPSGAPHSTAAKGNKDWQMVLRVANNDAVEMRPGATLDVNSQGEEIEADVATEEELAEATYTEAKPRLKGKFEKSASGCFGVAWSRRRGRTAWNPSGTRPTSCRRPPS